MGAEQLRIYRRPRATETRMILGFSGWMDGGEVSTGTVNYLLRKLKTVRVGRILSEGFYIYSFPGPMEVASMFRPHTEIENGLIKRYTLPVNLFFYNVEHRLVLFEGKEPNLKWDDFAECVFAAAETFNVKTIYFLGSYAGLVPHTRDPRLYASMSSVTMQEGLLQRGFRLSNYEGPAGIVTHLTQMAVKRGIEMASLVAEIPAYIQGKNPRCIETLAKRLIDILGLGLDASDLAESGHNLEVQVSKMIRDNEELCDMVRKLESQYDSDYLETEMGDLKEWLEDQGFELP